MWIAVVVAVLRRVGGEKSKHKLTGGERKPVLKPELGFLAQLHDRTHHSLSLTLFHPPPPRPLPPAVPSLVRCTFGRGLH